MTGLTVRTGVRAGGIRANHSETQAVGLAVRTGVKAGGIKQNHSEALKERSASKSRLRVPPGANMAKDDMSLVSTLEIVSPTRSPSSRARHFSPKEKISVSPTSS